ncbi:hypothetical protein ACWCQN_25290 [Streptomyces sp. NPDC001984]
MPPGPPKRPGFWSDRNKIIAAIVCAVIAGGITYAVNTRGGDASADTTADTSSDTPASTEDPAFKAQQQCAVSWNLHNPDRTNVGSLITSAQSSDTPTGYANVGFSTMFPDRCMITMANPATMIAMQYIQDGPDSWSGIPAWTGTVSGLDPSTTDWNARVITDGIVVMQEP